MSQTTFIPVPYFQFAPHARMFDFRAHDYHPVPNKKINCHCPFIIIDADYIDEPIMDVAVATAEEVPADTGENSSQPAPHPEAGTASDATAAKSGGANEAATPSETTDEMSEQDAEAARKEKERLDYLARQKADPRHNNANSFKTVETPDNPVDPNKAPATEAAPQPQEMASTDAATNAKTAANSAQPPSDNNADSDAQNPALPDYEAVPELSDEISESAKAPSAAQKVSDNKRTEKKELSNESDTEPKDDTKDEKKSKKSKQDKEELTEEEQLKKDKEAKLEAYKQFVAEQKSQVDVDYQGIRVSIEANALPSRMYFIMNALSAIIASYGLVINSAAVVIGAMLVAMMLGPISGVALAIIDYRMPFLRKSLMTVLAGGAMVVTIGFIVGFIHQDTALSNEILSRTQPTSMDLMIALAGGTAGAYAMISPHLSVAVVGVAVATALVPPLAASGILFAHGQGTLGFGALLLAITNIIAIQFTNALVLWFTGFRRLMEEDYKSSPMLAFFRRNAVPLLLLAVIGAYLTYNFNTITKRQTFENTVKEDINGYFIEKRNALTATQFLNREDHQTIRAVIRGETRPSSSDARYLEQVINEKIKEDYPKYLPVRIQLRYMPIVVIESSPEHNDSIDQTDAAILSNE